MKTWKNRPQKLLIIDPNFFFSNADWPKSSPNFNSCSIKISRRGTSLKWLWYEIDYIRLIMNANYLSHALNSRNMKVFDKKHSSVSSVIEDFSDGRFLWNRNWNLGWIWAGRHYWKKAIWADYEQLLRPIFSSFCGPKKKFKTLQRPL